MSGAPGAVRGAAPPPDTALLNGVVYTADRAHGVAQAVVIGDGRIVAAGSDEDVRRLCDSSTRLIDLGGGLVRVLNRCVLYTAPAPYDSLLKAT